MSTFKREYKNMMKNKFYLVIALAIFLILFSYETKAYDINVPVILDIKNGTLYITGENLNYSFNLKEFYNLTNNQTENKSLNKVLIIKLKEESAVSLEDLLRDMTSQCNRSMALYENYTACLLIKDEINRTKEELESCKIEKTNYFNVIESWRTNAAPYGIATPYDIKEKFESAKNNLWWLVILVGIVSAGFTYFILNRKGKAKKPEDIEREFD